MYTIAYRPDFHILEIAIAGFLTEATVADFQRDLAAALARAPKPAPASLYDYTDAAIQSQAVVALLRRMAREVEPGRRVPLYTGGRLARMQARRVAAECPTMRVFDDRIAALAWLTASPRGLAA